MIAQRPAARRLEPDQFRSTLQVNVNFLRPLLDFDQLFVELHDLSVTLNGIAG